MKELSIIIPHFNSVSLLRKLLSSIPNKTEIQIIVIDDKSTIDKEKYKKLQKEIEFDHIVFLKNNTLKKNAGTCRNIGLERAEGKWILFADSDDFFLTGFYNSVKKYFNSDSGVVYFSPTSLFLDTNRKANRHVKYSTLIENYLNNKSKENEIKLRYEFGVPWSKMIKREFLNKNKIFFDEVIARNDKLFSTKVGFYSDLFEVSNETIYCVTRSKGSITTTINENVRNSQIYVFIRNCLFLKKKLSNSDLKYISISGLTLLQSLYYSKATTKEFLITYKKLKRNNIKILDNRYLNPFFILKRILYLLNVNRSEKEYFIKK